MFNKIMKYSILSAGLLMVGTILAPNDAEARNLNVGAYIGTQYAPHYVPHYGNVTPIRSQRPRKARSCSPKKAVRKASRVFGLRRAWVKRIGRNRIVVQGRKYGQNTRIVFARYSKNCAIVKVR